MNLFALQLNLNEPLFWIMVASIAIAISFLVIAIAAVYLAMIANRMSKTVKRVEQRVEPLIDKANLISAQGKEIAEQFNVISGHMSTATRNISESTALIREEVAELKTLVGETAIVAKDKVALVSKTIDRTQGQVLDTTDFIQAKIVEPAREIAAIMAGFRKGLEVLLAPAPRQIDRVYSDEEMFIG
jgi:uncharacterized protein YoxC